MREPTFIIHQSASIKTYATVSKGSIYIFRIQELPKARRRTTFELELPPHIAKPFSAWLDAAVNLLLHSPIPAPPQPQKEE